MAGDAVAEGESRKAVGVVLRSSAKTVHFIRHAEGKMRRGEYRTVDASRNNNPPIVLSTLSHPADCTACALRSVVEQVASRIFYVHTMSSLDSALGVVHDSVAAAAAAAVLFCVHRWGATGPHL